MSNVSIKDLARKLVEALPAHATWEDLQYAICARQAIEAGLKDSQEGRTVPLDEARRRFRSSRNKCLPNRYRLADHTGEATMTMKELGIDRLSVEQRIALAQEIWESLGDARPTNLTAEQRQELRRRDAEMDANPEAALTWEQIRTSVERPQ